MEDMEEDMRAPRIDLASLPEDARIQVSDRFCTRIVQQNTQHCDRNMWHLLFLRLLKHSYPDQTVFQPPYPRPLKSPFPCWQCHRVFSGPPVFIPMPMLDGTREEHGNFCSGPCVNTYLHYNMSNVDLAARAADLFYYLQEVYDFKGTQIGFAPHFSLRREYGGHMTEEAFVKDLNEPRLTSTLRLRPFCPSEAVIEVVAPAGDILEGVVGVPLPTSVAERQHNKWEIRGIRMPDLKDIEVRLAGLPKTTTDPPTAGAYMHYIERRGFPATSPDAAEHADVMAIAAPKSTSQKRGKASDLVAKLPAQSGGAAPSGKNTLAGMLKLSSGNGNGTPKPKKRTRSPTRVEVGLEGFMDPENAAGANTTNPTTKTKTNTKLASRPAQDENEDDDDAAAEDVVVVPKVAKPEHSKPESVLKTSTKASTKTKTKTKTKASTKTKTATTATTPKETIHKTGSDSEHEEHGEEDEPEPDSEFEQVAPPPPPQPKAKAKVAGKGNTTTLSVDEDSQDEPSTRPVGKKSRIV
jgi:hypothetical protein